MSDPAPPVAVTYEDRPAAFPGVELLARSLARHAPGMRLVIHAPGAARRELARRLADLPRIELRQTDDLAGRGWNVKPAVLLKTLETEPRAIWLDTDIVITGDLAALLARFDPAALVAGQEFHVEGTHGGRVRARAFGFEPARDLRWHPNSGSLLVNRAHRALLQRWSDLLGSAAYQAAQRRPVAARPAAFVGDQDALWAAMVAPGFSDLPVDFIRTGTEMIQHSGANGYHLRDRMQVLRGARPVFVHMLGSYKPWSFAARPPCGGGAWRHMVAYELSPVFTAARPYAAALGNPPWLTRRTLPARLLSGLCLGNAALAGLPLALAASAGSSAKSWFRRRRIRPSPPGG